MFQFPMGMAKGRHLAISCAFRARFNSLWEWQKKTKKAVAHTAGFNSLWEWQKEFLYTECVHRHVSIPYGNGKRVRHLKKSQSMAVSIPYGNGKSFS